jgi:predicted alpha/beta-fold hydrolase
VIGNVREYESLVRDLPRTLLVITRRGSHCAYFEGWRPRSWANRLIADFLMNLEKTQG